MTYSCYDEFSGWGGTSQGITAVPGLELVLAANHDETSIDVHSLNFPGADHYRGDIAKADIAKFPRVDFFAASPACPPWTDARGLKRDFDNTLQGVLFDPVKGPRALDPSVARARALMEEIPRYLQAMRRKGKPVLGGMVENVIQVRRWDEFGRWRQEIEAEGYRTRLIALNAMHANGPRLGRVAQSRDRFFMGYWWEGLGRDPDWDKWLRPMAWCDTCDEMVSAIQVWKKPGDDMGRYGLRHGQYVYRCPRSTCRHQLVEPAVLGADTIIDWSADPGQRIGERVDAKGRPDPLEDATLERIAAGLVRHARPLLCPAGGTWRREAAPLDQPMATRTTRETDGLVVPPFISVLRGGGSKSTAYPLDRPITTVSAQGNHHSLVEPSPEVSAYLLAYYSNGPLRPAREPVGTLTTKDRFALVGQSHPLGDGDVREAVERSTFRMLAHREIAAGMGFRADYKIPQLVGGKKISGKKVVRGYGNAVPPAMAEVIASAIVETFSGEPLEPAS